LYLLTPLASNAQSQAAPAIQKMSKADRELTQKIRKAVVSDEIAGAGKVTSQLTVSQ